MEWSLFYEYKKKNISGVELSINWCLGSHFTGHLRLEQVRG